MDSDSEKDERMHVRTVITDQPPAYTMNPASVSTSFAVGASFGTGMDSGMGVGINNGVGVVGMNTGVVGVNTGMVGMHNPYGYGPPMMQSHHNGLVTTVAPGMAITTFSSKPAHITCQSCNAQIVTRLERQSTWKTHFFALAFAMVCCFPCCIAVYCIDDCKNAEHYCPECNSYIGSYVI